MSKSVKSYQAITVNFILAFTYFLNINLDGGIALKNIYDFFDSSNAKKSAPNYLEYFKKIGSTLPKNPVILMFDNEIKSKKEKPIGNFLNHAKLDDKKRGFLENNYMVNIIDNLYLLTVPLVKGKSECDIEDLFDNMTLSHKIGGRTFTKSDKYNVSKYYGKEMFSKYILNNYTEIEFNEFRSVLDNINNIIDLYSEEQVTSRPDFEERRINKSSADKVPLQI